MQKINFNLLKQIFLEVISQKDKYQALKRIDEFEVDQNYVGDMFNYTIFEDNNGTAPTFYQINSPYDIYSKKMPQQALVFSGGQIVQNIDFTVYVKVRTALLDALFLECVLDDDLNSKKVFMFGSGNVAKYSLAALNQLLNLNKLAYTNTHGADDQFESIANENNILASFKNFSSDKWDIVIMHTPGNEPLITPEHLTHTKSAAILMTYADGMELANTLYTPTTANLIVDYADNLKLAKDTAKALESKLCAEDDFSILLDALASGKKLDLDPTKHTIFRSKGTPYQNVAMLKYLVQKKGM